MSDANDFGYPVIDLPDSVASSETAIQYLVDYLVQSGRLEAKSVNRVVNQILHRESLGSTGIGRGVAIPHSKSEAVVEVLGVIGRCARPITWTGAADGKAVHLICLLVTPTADPGASLRALESVSRRLREL